MEDDGFQLVQKKRKRKKLPNASSSLNAGRFEQISLQQIDRVVGNAVDMMKNTMFLSIAVEIIRDVLAIEKNRRLVQIRAIGIGHFSGSEVQDYGCHQLALLLLLKKHFDCEATFQDPICTENEKLWLQSRNVKWLEATSLNECNICTDPGCITLFYMPHCDAALYNSVIYAHRPKVCLERMIILGNNLVSFSVISKYKDELSALLAYREVCKCLPLPHYDVSPFSFNNSAIHFLDEVYPTIKDEEPQYDYYKVTQP